MWRLWRLLCEFLYCFHLGRIKAITLLSKESDYPQHVSPRQRRWLLTRGLPYLDEPRDKITVVRWLITSMDGSWDALCTKDNVLQALRMLPRKQQDELTISYVCKVALQNPNDGVEMLHEMFGKYLPVHIVTALYHDAAPCEITEEIYNILWRLDKFAREQIMTKIADKGWLDAIRQLCDPSKPQPGVDMNKMLLEYAEKCFCGCTRDGIYPSPFILGREAAALECAVMLEQWEFVRNLIEDMQNKQNDNPHTQRTYPDLIKKAVVLLFDAGQLPLRQQVTPAATPSSTPQ